MPPKSPPSSIGDEVASTERLISTLQRLRVLDGRRKEEREASLEERKAATLGDLERRLRSEADAAVAVVDAFVAAANAYGRYKEIRSRPRPWSDLLTTHGLSVGIDNLIGSICGALLLEPHAGARDHGRTETRAGFN
jgi:hypothetical protein